MSENLYIGKGKQGKFGVRISVCLDDLFNYAKDNIEPSKNGKKYINLDVNPMKQKDPWNNTHTVKIDTWKPEPKAPEPPQPPADGADQFSSEDIPF